MITVVFDTETTSLLAPGAASQEHQPYLLEIAAIKLNESYEKIDDLYLRCKPYIDIPESATKIHGITNADVSHCIPFIGILPEIIDFFIGARCLVGHNLMFDKMVLYWELARLGKTLNFPWPPENVCTMEISRQMKGFNLSLTALHLELFGENFSGAHSASIDCDITTKCFVELVRVGLTS